MGTELSEILPIRQRSSRGRGRNGLSSRSLNQGFEFFRHCVRSLAITDRIAAGRRELSGNWEFFAFSALRSGGIVRNRDERVIP